MLKVDKNYDSLLRPVVRLESRVEKSSSCNSVVIVVPIGEAYQNDERNLCTIVMSIIDNVSSPDAVLNVLTEWTSK